MPADTEALYRLGVASWAERDLDGAVQQLSKAVEAGSPEDNWWHAASRALAQIGLEKDDLELADLHLRRLPEHWIGVAQTSALRAKRLLLGGHLDGAATEASVAVGCVASDPDDDVGSLMNGAMALAWCAEVLADLGFGHDVLDLVERARRRMRQAGIDDPVIAAVLTLAQALALRLHGRFIEAASTLEAVDITLSPDLEALVVRERARIAAESGDLASANRLYEEAYNLCAAAGYRSLARLIREEQEGSPPALKTDPDPVERWAERQMEQAVADSRPYAVVVKLMVTQDPQRLLDLTREIHGLLTERPELGAIDGTGTDGVLWEFFLDGEDGVALWEAVKPVVMQFGPEPGSQIEVRTEEGVEVIELV